MNWPFVGSAGGRAVGPGVVAGGRVAGVPFAQPATSAIAKTTNRCETRDMKSNDFSTVQRHASTIAAGRAAR